MTVRNISSHQVNPMGLGCMNLSHAYGHPPSEEQATQLLLNAIELGIDHFDTAALYGFGSNEKLLGKVLKPHRQKLFLASKCGMTGVDGKRVIDGRPHTLRKTIEQSLENLQTDVIDLYYLHRWDKSVPIEDSVGELSRLVQEGKIKHIGLSEVSAPTLQKAYRTHPIAAVQTEYSLWTRNPEIAVLNACEELGTAFVAFSPLGRGFLSGEVRNADTLVDGDIRKGMPRFQTSHAIENYKLLSILEQISRELDCTLAQVSLAWLLQRGKHILPIPGTTNTSHLQENMGALKITLSAQQVTTLNTAFSPESISGSRYPAATQQEIDTEEYC